MALELPRYRFTIAEYEQMGTAGIFDEDDRVELLDGDIIPMSPIGSVHASVVNRLTRILARLAGDSAIVQVQGPLRLAEHWEPQPDLVVLRARPDFYRDNLPSGDDVLLVVEVADSTARQDRWKLQAYASTGIPEAWLVDLQADVVVSHSEPAGESYQLIQPVRRGESLTPRAFPNASIQVADVLV